MIPCDLDLKSTPFSDTTIITHKIDFPPSGKKVVFNLLDGEEFTIPYINDTIQNSLDGDQLPSQSKRNLWIIARNCKETITAQGVLDELNCHKSPRGKSKINISLCRRKSYRRTYLE